VRFSSLLPLLLLSLPAFASGKCSLTDPSLTLQSYTVNPQREQIVMYWQKADGKAWGSLLADINQNGQVQMAMNGGIYDKAYALGLYIDNGRQLTPLTAPLAAVTLFVPAECSMCKGKRQRLSA
jgi:uncharacterized protein YigE (DUF2233 family)